MKYLPVPPHLFILVTIFAASKASASAVDPRSDRVTFVRVPNGGEAVEAQMTPDGTLHLLYDSGDVPYYVKSVDRGRSFSVPIPVVNADARKQKLIFSGSALAVSPAGAVYVAMMTNNWQVKLPSVPEGFVYAMLSPRAKAFSPVRSLNDKPSEGFSLATDANGGVAATWLSGKLFANFSHDGGRTFTSNAELNPSYDPCNCCTTRTVYGKDGTLAVLYREETNNERDMYVVLLSKDGRQSRTRISRTPWRINACPMTYYSISATDDGFVAAWPTKGEIYFTRLDRNGRAFPPGEIKTPGRSSMRSGILALGGHDGTTLVAWNHAQELGWELYDASGHPNGATGSIRTNGKGVAGVIDKYGNFLLFR